MSSKEPLFGRIRGPMFLMVLTILLSFLVPTILAQTANTSRGHEAENLCESMDAYLTLVNYNEPGNSWVLVNYYFENGSYIRMVYGIDNCVLQNMNLDYENNFVQVYDKKGKVAGFGFQSKSPSNLYVYVPV